jgi:hypothetical protein
MARYLRIWRLFAGAVAALGVLLELLTHPLSTLVALGAVSIGVSVCVGLGMSVGEPGNVVPLRDTVGKIGKAAMLAVVWLTALVGLASLGSMTMLLVGIVVLATSPLVIARVLSLDLAAARADHRAEAAADLSADSADVARRPTSVSAAELASADVATKDTRTLVRDWRRSFVALEQAVDPVTKAAVVQARQAFLDELERRDPDGLHEWLESGARAAGDPTKFMSRDEARGEPRGDHGHGGPQAA